MLVKFLNSGNFVLPEVEIVKYFSSLWTVTMSLSRGVYPFLVTGSLLNYSRKKIKNDHKLNFKIDISTVSSCYSLTLIF